MLSCIVQADALALLANSLCISLLAPVRSHAKAHPSRAHLPIYLVTLFPPPSIDSCKQGIPTAHLHTIPRLTNFSPPPHLPTSLTTSHTTPTTPIRAGMSAFLEQKNKDLPRSMLAQHRHQSSPRVKGLRNLLLRDRYAVKRGKFPTS